MIYTSVNASVKPRTGWYHRYLDWNAIPLSNAGANGGPREWWAVGTVAPSNAGLRGKCAAPKTRLMCIILH